jgi:hypothetical protein
MKNKKLLPLVLLAMAAVLMLSSCDAMLDAIFPSNQIFVDVAVFIPSHADYPFSTVTVILSGAASANGTASWDGYDSHGYAHYYFNFTDLKDGAYVIDAYYNPYSGAPDSSLGYLISMPDHSSGHSASIVIYM